MSLPAVLLAVAVTAAACSSQAGQGSPTDSAVDLVGSRDARGSDAVPKTELHVAAVQYSAGNHSYVPGCSDDVCGVAFFVRQAAEKGATIIATPEYAQDQGNAELAPAIGDTPATDGRWSEGGIVRELSKLATELEITLVFNLILEDSGKLYNTNLVVDAGGKVIARHYKFQLFGSESNSLTPGPNIENSFFPTRAGLAGTMICADAQCIVTKLNPSPDCTTHAIQIIKDYFAKTPKLIFFTSFWTVGGTGIWAALNVQKQVSIDGDVWLVGANNTKGQGKGGAIFEPGGKEVAKYFSDQPGVIYAQIPYDK